MPRAALAYVYLALFASSVAVVAWASTTLVDGLVSVPVGVAAAGCAFQALRGLAGRGMGAALDAS